MLTNGSRWCLITTYKENYSLFPALTAFYRRYYGIQQMMIFCGLTQGRTHESLKQLLASKLKVGESANDQIHSTPAGRQMTVSEITDGNFVLWIASYATTDFTSEKDFHDLKLELHQWADVFLPPEISRTLVVDNDEFLHVKNPCTLENLDCLGFHVVDVIPSPVWPPEKLRFSLQGWYYRRQAQPRFKHGGRLALVIAKKLGRTLAHGGCKTFYFDRSHLRDYTAWHHGTTESLCSCFAVDHHLYEPQRCVEILKETACCYHLAMTCKEHFLSERLRLFSRLQTDMQKRPENDRNSGQSPETKNQKLAIESFDRYIKESIFPVIEDNFLLPYLQDRRAV